MKSLTFVTPNGWKHEEARRLLSSIDVHWSREGLPSPRGLSLEDTARARAAAAYEALGVPVFVENTELAVATAEHGLRDGIRGGAAKRLLEALGEPELTARYGGLAADTRVVVALATGPRPRDVMTFEGEISGTIAEAPRGDHGYGWDRIFVPEGYTRTLAELASSKFLVNMRERPYLDLADHVLGRAFGGSFEAHVTVAPGSAEEMRVFAASCDALGVKCVRIVLPHGVASVQPMTASYHRGTLREVQDEVNDLARALVRAGFRVTRVKIEAHGRNADVPRTREEAMRLPPQNYFEHHVKVVLPPGASLDGVASVAARHDAHLSRNANVVRSDGSEERFVTLRSYHVGRDEAEARFEALLDALEGLGFPLKNRLREYTVVDSDVAVDAGWMAT